VEEPPTAPAAVQKGGIAFTKEGNCFTTISDAPTIGRDRSQPGTARSFGKVRGQGEEVRFAIDSWPLTHNCVHLLCPAQGCLETWAGLCDDAQTSRLVRRPGRGEMTKTMLIAGVNLELVERGDGRPLLFLHAGEGLAPERQWLDLLSRKYRVIAPWHPGWRKGRAALEKSIRLDPRNPNLNLRLLDIAISYYLSCEYDAAVEAAKRGIRTYPDYSNMYRWLAAALGQAGRIEEAKEALANAIAMAPAAFDMFVRRRVPWHRPEDHAHMLEGLRKAGWDG
jgi:hypothetical protein